MLLLIAGVVLLIAGLAVWQARARQRGERAPIDKLLMEVLAPSLRVAGAARDLVSRELPVETDPLTPVSLARLRQLEEENQRLRELMALRQQLPGHALAAEVIGRGSSVWQGYLQLGKGKWDGVAPKMVALAPAGVIGQVVTTTPHTAEVLPLTDRACGIGAMTTRGKACGVLKGYRNGKCALVYLSGQSDVAPGDEVVTSGLGRVYPKGLPLGIVERVEQDTALSSRIAIVTPAANPAKVEYVVVVGYTAQ